jgi:hypothetical protein
MSAALCFLVGFGVIIGFVAVITGIYWLVSKLPPLFLGELPMWVQVVVIVGVCLISLVLFVAAAYDLGCTILHPGGHA